MAKLSARGRTELLRRESFTYREALMSDGNMLRNYGHGWKQQSKIKSHLTPTEAAAIIRRNDDELKRSRPRRADYVHLLTGYPLPDRYKIHESIRLMPNDCDGVWSTLTDTFSPVNVTVEDCVELCAAFNAMVAEKKEAEAMTSPEAVGVAD